MNSLTRLSLTIATTSTNLKPIQTKPNPPPPNLHFSSTTQSRISIRVSSSSKNPLIHKIRTTASSLILTAATLLMIGKLSQLPARAEPPPTVAIVEKLLEEEEENKKERNNALLQFVESNAWAIDSLESMIQEMSEMDVDGDEKQFLIILKRLAAAQPMEIGMKLLTARVLNELRDYGEVFNAIDVILKGNPISYEALYEGVLNLDHKSEGRGENEMIQLEEALKIAVEEMKSVGAARGIRLVMAQVCYIQKDVDEALRIYGELVEEDPEDYRPYFGQGVVYALMDRNVEAREMFAKWHELNPTKLEVVGS